MENKNNKTLLIVDDAEDMCTSLRDVFTDIGYKTDIATNRTDAIKLLEKQPYDIILVDLVLEKFEGGVKLIKKIKEMELNSSVFAMTAHQKEDLIKDAMDSGALKLFNKPFDITELVDVFKKEIKKRETKGG